MSDKNKPEITATIKFRGVTVEGMTVQELRELRDLLNSLVGVERVIERHEYHPWRYWTTNTYTVDNNGHLFAGNSYATNEIVISCVQ